MARRPHPSLPAVLWLPPMPYSFSRRLAATALIAAGHWCAQGVAGEQPPSFRNDVMAVLSKAGCNLGTCHGNATGKGGLKLSLRGDDPERDLRTLSRDLLGRRLNALDVQQSLLLLKPTMQVAHGGGRRFAVESAEYEVLRAWIAAGMPEDSEGTPRLTALRVTPSETIIVRPESGVQLAAEAEFSDGSRRDVTAMAVYEPSAPIVDITPGGLVSTTRTGELTIAVRFLNRQVPVRLAFIQRDPEFRWSPPAAQNEIDEIVFARLRELEIHPSQRCDDTAFLRRATLDLLGLLPTADEAREFVQDARPDKRAALVERQLERPEFAEHWALKWSDLLHSEEKTLDRKGVENFHAWLRTQFARNRPLDEFAREILTARGSTYANPPANFYRALRDPAMRAESAAQVFLGLRLQCAKCHNHPFDRWTQDDYYRWGSLFSRVDYKVLENRRRDDNDKHEFVGEQIVYMDAEGKFEDPRIGRPAPPRVLGGDDLPEGADRLEALAAWATSPENPYFARSQVNRIWYHLLGRGLVDPVDDFRATNPASHPALLDRLAEDFVRHGFDLRHTVRTIMNSAVYQLSSAPSNSNAGDETHFARAHPRRLSAEQLADALSQVTGVPLEFAGFPAGVRAGQLPGVHAVRPRDQRPTEWDEFLVRFGKPPRLQSCECERSEESTLGQTFLMIAGAPATSLFSAPGGRIARMIEEQWPNERIVEELYWSALSRGPTDEERAAMMAHLEQGDDRRGTAEDVAWAVMNSNEFLFRR